MQEYDYLSSASDLAKKLQSELKGASSSETLRNRTAVASLGVSLDHQWALLMCLHQQPPLHASAFALLRIQYEALVRGLWISDCASDQELHDFINGEEPPKIKRLIEAIEEKGGGNNFISVIHEHDWKVMCGYAHTGWTQIANWSSDGMIQPRYSAEVVRGLLWRSSRFALTAAAGIADLMGDVPLHTRILEMRKSLLQSP